ncbi:MAG: 5-formyltetrahydrofolate cyclo-ligase [Rhizomicrobium sp.]
MRIHTPTANAVPSTLPSKAEIREIARRRRADLRTEEFAAALAAHAGLLKIPAAAIVAGYHAHRDEADPALLLQALATRGMHIAFPRVAAKHAALEFHRIPDGEMLRPGAFGIHEPLAHWPVATPDVLLVPLLAFDNDGYRLGYGGGYYDRSLAVLPRARAIGIAYAGQRVDILPRDAHDCRLNAVLTENGLTEFPQ